ncbi:MAG: type II toxin-antitoxin system prevent-host-death family antitoxin [Pseudomonadales bacterium]|jgi:prevent-host-death family protein|nr:type II toxin-antitoxin system prevent-host-death family antitoxin [Pseudomonadales bacterium]
MPPVLTISNARQKFFDLFEAVTARHGRKVIITSRGATNHAALIGESYLNELESAAKRLRDIEAGHDMPADSFKLVGSGRVSATAEDPVAQIRLEAAAAAEKKLASLANS